MTWRPFEPGNRPAAESGSRFTQVIRLFGLTEALADADILLVPDLEAGNMVAKQLQYLAGAEAAGIVCGTRVPIVLTSRADTVRARLVSAAVLKLVAHDRRERLLPRP